MQDTPKMRAGVVGLVAERSGEYSSLTAACQVVARQTGVGKESLRRWVHQAEIDAGHADEVSTGELAEIRHLKAENKRLREDVAILKVATSFFVGELDPATVDHGLHR